MPEYLAPAVYVEEVDTGSKPIEGVSTSTAGMLGVTERGPDQATILVTSYGEFTRWYGERLNRAIFSDPVTGWHCYLPHAVEGFFLNGGKRLYVRRVVDAAATRASTRLFDRGTAASLATSLLSGVTAGGTVVSVASAAGLANGMWVQVGSGSDVEYRRVQGAPVAGDEVPLGLPLARPHPANAAVDHLAPAPAPSGAAMMALTQDAQAGDMQITVNAVPAGLVPGTNLLRIGGAAGDNEYVFFDAAAGNTIPLRTPLVLSHPIAGTQVEEMTPGTVVAADATNFPATVGSAAGEALVHLQNTGPYQTRGDFVRIAGAVPNDTEMRRIGEFGSTPLAAGAYADYAVGSIVEAVNLADVGAVVRTLQQDVDAGATVLSVNDRSGLQVGNVLRTRLAADPEVEYVTIRLLPNRTPGADPGNIVLESAVGHDHPAGTPVQGQSVARAAPGATTLLMATPRNGQALILSDHTGFNAPLNVRVIGAGGASQFHSLAGASTALTPMRVTLDSALDLPHVAGSPLMARDPLLLVEALDAGGWGNRLRVSAQDNEPPLLRTTIREIPDATHIRLQSSTGVETGTVLQLADATGAPTGNPMKVIHVDRQNNYLITLDAATPLPGAAGLGAPIRTREFQIEVLLLRQPDPAMPSRGEQVLDSEVFRHLSLDHRHSRYIHKVMGTTWSTALGTVDDFDGRPLRQSDRRSEGESSYVRVRDQAANQAATEAIRLGPDILIDILPDGRRRPARLSLRGGDDSIGTITDNTYIGTDDPEPENRTGLHSLRNFEDISIVACPGRTSAAIQNALINHCELMRYRFAVLDGREPPNDAMTDVQVQRQQFDTKYAALYHPWLLIPDPFPVLPSRPGDYPIPPSGHVTGIYARTDIERGVHKAPANEVVRGVLGLRRILNKEQHDLLNPYPVNINVIRDFRSNNRGIRVYGGRVITSDSDWKYVNVRRLLIFIEHSIDRGLQWVVFEPNAEPLWARVRRSIVNFLTLVWRNGGLEGTKVEEAFYVKCDRTTMTQTDIDSGRLICLVGVAPVKPAEFVIVRIGLWTARSEE